MIIIPFTLSWPISLYSNANGRRHHYRDLSESSNNNDNKRSSIHPYQHRQALDKNTTTNLPSVLAKDDRKLLTLEHKEIADRFTNLFQNILQQLVTHFHEQFPNLLTSFLDNCVRISNKTFENDPDDEKILNAAFENCTKINSSINGNWTNQCVTFARNGDRELRRVKTQTFNAETNYTSVFVSYSIYKCTQSNLTDENSIIDQQQGRNVKVTNESHSSEKGVNRSFRRNADRQKEGIISQQKSSQNTAHVLQKKKG
ncbi:unnamed protein product [Didymodactylos carnosus]|uniref:Uncharacterized protein n=1 Tax=Didymodactylos carnosus TaxID=1234261 RepID=A0A813TFE3_9BILA|nr:unnamed protein product [Didymodactylos carnosus]CAF0811672.1 unnamed protein product [Didymodactylos carnosus]CAF3498821.1 unnamed protein product [Didymodactylos carnosus]CAF3597344.1 unnamed protein product [Didymodactylos carnosus]